MTIDELARESGVKISTIIKNISSIKGASQNSDGEYVFESGTRYPFDSSRYPKKTKEDRIIIMLRATHRFRYVDEVIVGCSHETFAQIVDHLLKEELIVVSNDNPYGMNKYITTMKCDEFLERFKKKRIRFLTENIGLLLGGFCSAMVD